MQYVEGFLLLLSYFTRIPFGDIVEYTEDKYRRGVHLFPLVGVLISTIMLAGIALISGLTYGLLRGALIFLLYVLITGAIHIDGFADSLDGFFSGRQRDRILEIMSDPHVGTFGMLGIVLYALIFSGVFAEAGIYQFLGLSLFAYVGRLVAYICASVFEYAKPRGMGKIFVDSANSAVAALHCSLFIPFVIVLDANFGVGALQIFAAAAAALAAGLCAAWSSKKKIGGLTGDSMGFIIEISQLVYLLAMGV